MSVPMSQYEALLEEVRCLRRKAQHVQQLAAPLISSSSQTNTPPNAVAITEQTRQDVPGQYVNHADPEDFAMESLGLNGLPIHQTVANPCNNEYEHRLGISDVDNHGSEDEYGRASSATHMSVSSEPISQKTRGMANLYHGTWPVERTTMWNSEPTNLAPVCNNLSNRGDHTSVMSFASSSGGAPLDRVLSSPDHSRRSSQQLEAKMDMVYSLLTMLSGQEHADMGETLLALSTSPESCLAMRQSGCIPLLVQLVQSDKDADTRKKASQALHNLIYAQPDEKLKKRESRVLKLLEQARLYTEALKNNTEYVPEAGMTSEDGDKHPTLAIAHVMKLSFDEGHRQAICQLGGIHVIANLVETEHFIHGSTTEDTQCILMRRYACMALTNLTFGDSGNKALLCSFKDFMRALVVHLQSPSDELRQVTASVLRNLSWRADPVSKEILREVGTVTGLMKAAMMGSKENTLKSILSALWNLSAHCTENKAEICAIEGALGFLVDMLSYKTPSKSLAVIENSGGILRNISSQIAVREDYREILRQHNCLQVLLEQLKSPSLTIVSNACGTLWNLSAKNAQDQEALWQMGAPAMLRSLNHSKHKMIAMGSSAALKNLLSSRPSHSLLPQMDATAKAMDLPILPTLGARKQKALLQDLDQNLHETFDNIESPTKTAGEEKFEKYIPTQEFIQKTRRKHQHVFRSESQECVSHTELVYETRTSRSDTSARNDRVLEGDRTSRKDSWKEELKIDISKTRLPHREDRIDRDKGTSQLCQPFSSLNLNEPSTSSTPTHRTESRASTQAFGSSSLPYTKRTGAYVPVRNNYSDCAFEDEIDPGDQPIDFSRKYAEIKSNNVDSDESDGPKLPNASGTYVGIYAETDLDQPTDYSLRYAEDDSDDSDMCCDKKGEFIRDTVKTYYTEGTPYETPFNFSTATSMSDLRMESNDKAIIDNEKASTEKVKAQDKNTSSDLDEKDRCSVEDVSENEGRPKSDDKVLKSQFSSGLMSPEKPVNYCEEGTPGYFSRVSSFGSLNSIPVNEHVKCAEDKADITKESEINLRQRDTEQKSSDHTSPHEGAKAVKFEQTVNYAEETPLMFSRSSSLASLDSVEQHSIHDDRSSVVSDLSRLTSGLVSPSELPDSPSQTVPPSPKPRKGPLEYPSNAMRMGSALFQRTAADGRPQPAPRTIQKSTSVFEDNVTKFKEESTPMQFSTATSLSSLTIDDHEDVSSPRIKDPPPKSPSAEDIPSNAAGCIPTPEKLEEKKDVEQEKLPTPRSVSSELNDDLIHISDHEGDDDILADCINIGMQNRHRQNKENPSTTTSIPANKLATQPTHPLKYTPKLRPQGSGIPMLRSGIPMRACPAKVPENRLPTAKPEILNASDTVRTYCTEDTPAILSHAGSNSDLSAISIPHDTSVKKDYLSDDSSNLSGDNDNILAECIQSAMPKPKKPPQKPLTLRQIPTLTKNVAATSTPIKPFNRESSVGKIDSKLKMMPKQESRSAKNNKIPTYVSPRDEIEKFAIENSPCQFSLRSSLSDLTVDSSVAELKRTRATNHNEASSSCQSQETRIASRSNTNQVQSNISREGSLSSLSVESGGSLEAEQALLEQCISSGMPKSKVESTGSSNDKPVGVATKQYNVTVKMKYNDSGKHRGIPNESCRSKGEDRSIYDGKARERRNSDPKNAFVTSVVENTSRTAEDSRSSPTITATIADVTETRGEADRDRSPCSRRTFTGTKMSAEVPVDTSPDKYSPTKEISSTDLRSNGFDRGNDEEVPMLDDLSPPIANDRLLNGSDSIDDLGKIVNNRMLDPDAMIESLDRFTAELVSQAASHMQQQKDETKFQTSVTEAGDTWNEDVSPNDVTFPSISGSTPNVITFSDETGEDQIPPEPEVVDVVDGVDQKSNDFSSLNTSTLTESTLIAMEATKMATTFKNEADMSLSAASIELDAVQPPSQLNSLTNSVNELEIRAKRSPKTVMRKKSLPGAMVRRALLSNSLNQASSIESLENQSLSNLDNINAPSMLADIDFLDLESSLTSVASLQSEVADVKGDFLVNGVVNKEQTQNVNPIFAVKQPANMLHLLCNNNSNCSELENINPPSLFNEITDFCNSLADVPTEVVSSDVFEDCRSSTDATLLMQTENDVTHFSDANSITPIQTDASSNESTPRKTRRLLTAKQKRSMAKDRYKTYTVDADLIAKDEAKPSDESITSASPTDVAKLTPKERRQNNRSRYETQILDRSISEALETGQLQEASNVPAANPEQELNQLTDNSNSTSPSNSSPVCSPARTKLSIRRNFLQKRLENKDRFKTKTLSESSLSPEILSASPTNMTNSGDLHLLLQKEANMILKTLSETKSKPDELLDCETLSLVSNEDDSEYNSGCSINYRTYHKSWGFAAETANSIPVINLETPENGRDDYGDRNSNEVHEPAAGTDDAERNSEDVSPEQTFSDRSSEHGSESEAKPPAGKPKIVKPGDKTVEAEIAVNTEEQCKGVRGRRKALYSKAGIAKTIPKPSTTVNNNMKNIPSKIAAPSTNNNRNISTNKPPLPKLPSKVAKTATATSTKSSPPNSISPKHISPARASQLKSPNTTKTKLESKPKSDDPKPKPVLERQGTFTKEDSPSTKSKIPTTTSSAQGGNSSSIPKPTRIARAVAQPPLSARNKSIPITTKPVVNGRIGIVKSASTDRANKTAPNRIINRSPSADARDVTKRSSLQYSSSNSNLRNASGAVKRASAPEPSQRSSSNSSLTSNSSSKQVPSKIANLWKRTNSKTDKKNATQTDADSNINGEADSPTNTRLIRSNTFENKDSIILQNVETTKRVSRLGSFVVVDESEVRIRYEERSNVLVEPPEVTY